MIKCVGVCLKFVTVTNINHTQTHTSNHSANKIRFLYIINYKTSFKVTDTAIL